MVEPIDVAALVTLVRQVIARSDSFDTALNIQLLTQAWNVELSQVIHSLSIAGGTLSATQEDNLIVVTLRMLMDCVSDLSRLKNGAKRQVLQSLYDHGIAAFACCYDDARASDKGRQCETCVTQPIWRAF